MGTFHNGSIPFSEQRSIFVGRRNCHAWPFVATSQEAVLILQALRRSAESGHGFAAHYSKALGKLREKHAEYWYVLVTLWWTNIAMENGHLYSHEKLWFSIAMLVHQRVHVSFGWMDGLCHTKKKSIYWRRGSNSRASARITLLPARRSVVACYYQGNGGQKHPGIFRIRGRFRGFCGPYAWRNHLWLGQIHGFKPWMLRVGLNIIKLGWFKMVQTCSN